MKKILLGCVLLLTSVSCQNRDEAQKGSCQVAPPKAFQKHERKW